MQTKAKCRHPTLPQVKVLAQRSITRAWNISQDTIEQQAFASCRITHDGQQLRLVIGHDATRTVRTCIVAVGVWLGGLIQLIRLVRFVQ